MKALFDRWCWKMAWRDSRAHRKRILLFLGCICIGVAALVALRSFGSSVKSGIVEQSKTLLGSDLLIKSRSPHDPKLTARMLEISSEDVREWRFSSMGKFPASGKVPRLVQIRGVETGFPIYGEVETEPANAAGKLFDGSDSALIDETLKIQFDVKVGDKMKIGESEFTVEGFIKSLPGEGFIISELAPRVLIPFKKIKDTKLISFGSRVFYRHYFKYNEDVDEKKLIPELEDAEIEYNIFYETVQDRQEAVDKTLSNLFHFLNLVAFIALLLGGIGIGSAIRVHINTKLKNAAVLRCLGASRSQAVSVYIIQSLCMGVLGGIAGSILGTVLQKFLPVLLGAIMPLKVETSFSLEAFALGVATGTIITFLFSLTPLLKLNKMTAKDSLNSSLSIDEVKTRWSWLIMLLLIALIIGFSVMSATTVKVGVYTGIALIFSLGVLIVMAWVLMKLVKKLIPGLLPFIWRQGLKNLYRPKNQTLTLVCSLGTGTFLIAFLYLSQENMLHQVRKTEEGNNPNVVLFDIQTDQVEGVNDILKSQGLEPVDVIPLVSMRISSINGKNTKDILRANKKAERSERIPSWTLKRTYRVTYRDKLSSGESILEGKFTGKADLQNALDGKIRVPISVEEKLMETLTLNLGDNLTFELGGIQIPCVVDSVRRIEWMQMRPNFFIVFPAGILDEAPQMIVTVTRTMDQASSVKLQAAIADQYTNISVLDLTLVVKTVTNMLDKASLAVKVMAGFSIITGLIILICSLHLSQMQRLKDNTLLKVLGASKKQVIRILFSEFCFLALLSANAGALLAYLGNWAMAEFVFENHSPFNWSVLLFANLILLFLTVIIGFMVSSKTYKQASLEVLMSEG
jgi:putative ABC transport system permease protein